MGGHNFVLVWGAAQQIQHQEYNSGFIGIRTTTPAYVDHLLFRSVASGHTAAHRPTPSMDQVCMQTAASNSYQNDFMQASVFTGGT